MKISLILFCVICLLGSGCTKRSEEMEQSNVPIQQTDESKYDILNDGFASSRNFTSKTSDLIHVEKRMIEISKEYFMPESSVLDQGRFLNQSDLIKLLSSVSADPDGLNMAKDEILLDGGQEFPAMRNIISNIAEMDFYSRDDLNRCIGVSLCLLVNTQASDYNYENYELSLSGVQTYAESVSKKLLVFLRNREELKEVPILLMIYSLKSEDDSLPGVMISKAYCEGEKSDFVDLNEKWRIFPSSAAQREDEENSMRIQILKDAISSYTKETVTIFAKGHYIDDEADLLNVTVQTYSGSYQFNLGLVQLLAEQCNEFGSLNLKLRIEIQYYDDVIFTISKQMQQEKCTILDLS